MKELKVKPGDVVVTDFGAYQHWSIVTDRLCEFGRNMLISATKRNGTVREEAWHVVTQGKNTYIADVQVTISPQDLLAKARSVIGKWNYSVLERNCEHFVKWAAGLKITSRQVVSGVAGGVAGGALVAAISEEPKLLPILGGGLLVAGIAVWAAKASEKRSETVPVSKK